MNKSLLILMVITLAFVALVYANKIVADHKANVEKVYVNEVIEDV